MRGTDLHSFVSKKLPNAVVSIADGSYASPTIEWIEQKLYPKSFLPWMERNGLNKWKEQFDCDNFSYLFFVFSQICHAKTQDILAKQGKEVMEGISVGVMYYTIKNNGGGHAINFIVSKGQFYTFEPQVGKCTELTQEELDSCWFALC